jgi:hypothetical protein
VQLEAVVAALQKQLQTDYSPAWGPDAEIVIASSPEAIPESAWQLVLLDDSDHADALGYHELSVSGAPLGKVFVRSVEQSGGRWSVAASHELLEMMADPGINLAAEGYDPENRGATAFFAYEACDPVEGDTYEIDGVAVSDFVYPEYFELNPPPKSQFDRLRLLKEPFSLRPGGYMSILPIARSARWKQIFGESAPAFRVQPKPGGRRFRRMIPRREWRRSDQ